MSDNEIDLNAPLEEGAAAPEEEIIHEDKPAAEEPGKDEEEELDLNDAPDMEEQSSENDKAAQPENDVNEEDAIPSATNTDATIEDAPKSPAEGTTSIATQLDDIEVVDPEPETPEEVLEDQAKEKEIEDSLDDEGLEKADTGKEIDSPEIIEEVSAIEKEIDNTFPEEERDVPVVSPTIPPSNEASPSDASEDVPDLNDNANAESIDEDTIAAGNDFVNNETESTIVTVPPPLPSREQPAQSNDSLPGPPLPARGPSLDQASDNAEESIASPPLPSRGPSLNREISIPDEVPLDKSSLILNRLDVMIRDLTAEGKYVPKVAAEDEQLAESPDEQNIWQSIIDNPVDAIKHSSKTLEDKLMDGIDETVRPMVWKSTVLDYDHDWKPMYDVLVKKKITEEEQKFIDKQIAKLDSAEPSEIEPLSRIVSALISLDSTINPPPEVLRLIVVAYRVFKEESGAFGIMVTLMKTYSLSDLYADGSESLSVLLYQFDRLLEENCHDLYDHLIKTGVRSSMFARNWFLTCFASVLPIEHIEMILDVVFFEGLSGLLKFALILMMNNEDKVLDLKFDDLLFHCQKRLFEPYLFDREGSQSDAVSQDEDSDNSDMCSVEHKKLVQLTVDNFDIKRFIKDAFEKTRITPELLKRYTDEYVEIHKNELDQEEQFQQLREENERLQNAVRELEKDYTSLNREHVNIANEVLQNDIKAEGVREANTKMKMEILELRRHLDQAIRKYNNDTKVLVPNDIRKDLEKTLRKNSQVMQQNSIYQDRIMNLEKLAADIKEATANGIDYDAANGIQSGSFATPILSSGWTGLKKVFK